MGLRLHLRREATRSHLKMDEAEAASALYPVAVRNVQAVPIEPPVGKGPSATSALPAPGEHTSNGRRT